ncbi:MAG: hypothetical protein U9N42_00440 [Campylobacterota bacterium]|nr:hypothetical protein [Campylobacterota bacterium]
MTMVDEKEILEIEKLKVEVQKMLNDTSREDLKIKYEAWRLAFYGVAVGAGGVFAIAKTLQTLG